jgi:hypothetical protein
VNNIKSLASLHLFRSSLFYFYCAGWWYIVAFTKVLTMYQRYRSSLISL